MRLHLLFPTMEITGLYRVFIKIYSKNTQGSSILKCIIRPFSIADVYSFGSFSKK
jgi:hypothetical protein